MGLQVTASILLHIPKDCKITGICIRVCMLRLIPLPITERQRPVRRFGWECLWWRLKEIDIRRESARASCTPLDTKSGLQNHLKILQQSHQDSRQIASVCKRFDLDFAVNCKHLSYAIKLPTQIASMLRCEKRGAVGAHRRNDQYYARPFARARTRNPAYVGFL